MSDKMSHGERLRLARITKRQQQEMEKNGMITANAWAVKKIYAPKKDENGQWMSEVAWENSFVSPSALYGCESVMTKTIPQYQGKSTDYVRKDLYLKQCENLKVEPEIDGPFIPDQHLTEEQMEEEIKQIEESFNGTERVAKCRLSE